ncbi:MAG: hypothetical protein ACM3ZR_10940 [Pseudomonadota bacterium]
MINEALAGLRDISRKCGCPHIMDNIDITMDVMRKSSDEDEKSISALALSFFADYAIDRRNIELLHNIYELSESLGLLEEFQSRKAYEIIYVLRDETLNVYPKGFRELISFIEGLEAEELDYRIVPYDPDNNMIIE